MEELELKLRHQLINKKIIDIEFYNVNESYYVFNLDSKWVIDGGIQLVLENTKFSLGWDYENQGYDYSFDKNTVDLLEGSPFYAIGAQKIKGITALSGKTIIGLTVKSQYYLEYDDEAQLTNKKTYVPVELILTLDSNELLHFALINFNVNKENNKIENPVYDLAGELLVSLNEKIEIATAQEAKTS